MAFYLLEHTVQVDVLEDNIVSFITSHKPDTNPGLYWRSTLHAAKDHPRWLMEPHRNEYMTDVGRSWSSPLEIFFILKTDDDEITFAMSNDENTVKPSEFLAIRHKHSVPSGEPIFCEQLDHTVYSAAFHRGSRSIITSDIILGEGNLFLKFLEDSARCGYSFDYSLNIVIVF